MMRDYLNVRRVMRLLAREWGMPVVLVKKRIQQALDEAWERAKEDPEAADRLNKYFPAGKPTPRKYILLLGHAHEQGEDIPYLLK